ncbi:hypothetical protein [Nocardioides sambongensis]|uniref:hypothetical protein n=1 Tax=Nocardioides sambongensis TaxID=2589074 RepID=UPI00112A1AB8|nr:hypothetical protein [Nocardioides sambongensis]
MSPPAVDRRRPGLVWPVAIDPAGITGPTRAQARGPHWRRDAQGLYLPTGLDPDLATDQRIVTAAAAAPEGSAVTGWAALRWAGVRFLDGTAQRRPLPVPVAAPASAYAGRPGTLVSTADHLRRETVEIDGLTVGSAASATAFEVMRATTLVQAVAVIDRVAAADLASLDELRAFRRTLQGLRNVRRLDRALEHAVENCWSPMETVLRMCWHERGITNVVCNRPVFALDGTFLGTPDVLDLDTGTAAEYDGALHLAGRQRATDIRREATFRRAGLEYVEMVAADLPDPGGFLQRTDDARRRAAGLVRGWTLTPPPWWVQTHAVALRRGLEPRQRARFLRWQAS